jgi:hypothetical protein
VLLGLGGSITPPGVTASAIGGSLSYNITPSAGFTIVDVFVDGVSQGSVTSYAFTGVAANHTISAEFGSGVLDATGQTPVVFALDGARPIPRTAMPSMSRSR